MQDGAVTRQHTDFARAFATGSRFRDPTDDTIWTVEVHAVGHLDVPTGGLAISDPGYLQHQQPDLLDVEVLTGRWPCEVAVANGTVAAMRVRFGAAPARAWAPAKLTEDGRLWGFGVDSGLIAIFDARAMVAAHQVDATVDPVFMASSAPSALVVSLPAGPELFVSRAGKGDGAYPAWWGVDDDGARVELVVEFDVLLYATSRSFDIPLGELPAVGPVLDPGLAMDGIAMEVVSGEDVEGPLDIWSRLSPEQLAHLPEGHRARRHDDRAVALAVRTAGSSATSFDLALVDDAGERVYYEGGGSKLVVGDEHTYSWRADPALERAASLRVLLRDGPFPMPPA